MLSSMTGFASKVVHIERQGGRSFDANLTLKSLNSRFFEASCRLPSSFAYVENDLIKILRKKMLRGTVYANLYISSPSALKTFCHPSINLIKEYVEFLKNVGKQLDLAGKITVSDVIKFPNALEHSEEILVDPTIKDKVLSTFDELVDIVVENRVIEGKLLEKDIATRLENIKVLFEDLKKRFELVSKKKHDELVEYFKPALESQPGIARDMQLHFLQAQMDRYQINEELVRFSAHVSALEKTLKDESQEKAKRIDFVLQELFRETNTITAKANDADLSTFAISIKVEIEKIREQVQNVL